MVDEVAAVDVVAVLVDEVLVVLEHTNVWLNFSSMVLGIKAWVGTSDKCANGFGNVADIVGEDDAEGAAEEEGAVGGDEEDDDVDQSDDHDDDGVVNTAEDAAVVAKGF